MSSKSFQVLKHVKFNLARFGLVKSLKVYN